MAAFNPTLQLSATSRITCKVDFGIPLEGETSVLLPLDGDLQRKFQFSFETQEAKFTTARVFKFLDCKKVKTLLRSLSRTISLLASFGKP